MTQSPMPTLQKTLGCAGIARVFYGDASKWRRIYDANRKTIKNPDVIDGALKLTIPKLDGP